MTVGGLKSEITSSSLAVILSDAGGRGFDGQDFRQ